MNICSESLNACSGNVFIEVPQIAGMVRRTIPVILGTFMKTFYGKSLTKNEGKDHIYLDNFGIGSIYVITYIYIYIYTQYTGLLIRTIAPKIDLERRE